MEQPLRRLLKRLGVGLFGAAFLVAAQAQDFTYTTDNGAITISGYTGLGGNVNLPESIGGLPVTGIGVSAFYGCPILTGISIPSSVTNIGDHAFDSCTNLTGVSFSGNAPSLGGDSVFTNVPSAIVYYDPEKAGWGATFGGLPAAPSFPVKHNFSVVANSGKNSIRGYSGPGGAVTIPELINGLPVTGIAPNAFSNWLNLTSIVLPGTLTTIGSNAFYHCSSLATITIPAGVTNLGDHAFDSCSSLASVLISGDAPALEGPDVFANSSPTLFYLPGTAGWDATFAGRPTQTSSPIEHQFTYTTNNGTITLLRFTGPDTDVVIPASINAFPVTTIGTGAFFNRLTLTNVVIPDSATSIEQRAFYLCSGLATVTIPSGVTNIGDNAFNRCGGLTNLLLSDGVNTIGRAAFLFCTNLTSVTVGNGLANIGDKAFAYCTKLASMTLNDGVTNVGDHGFSWCSSLTNMVLGSSVTRIGKGAFNYCTNLAGITVPDSVSTMGDGAFFCCAALTNLALPNSATGIGDWTFGGCVKLPAVTLPNSVQQIGNAAFSGCASLTAFSIPSGVTGIGGTTFLGCTNLSVMTVADLNPAYSSSDGILFNKDHSAVVYCPEGKIGQIALPDGVTSVGEAAFFDCGSVTAITMGAAVTSIGSEAFGCCDGLTNVYLPNSVTTVGDNAFSYCSNLVNVSIGGNLDFIGDSAFYQCARLTNVFFQGDAPALGGNLVFTNAPFSTIYYLPGAAGWGSSFAGRPVVLWNPAIQPFSPNFGVRPSGFTLPITGNTNLPIVVEATTNVISPSWTSLLSCRLTNGLIIVTDAQWTNFPARFYRIRSP